MKKFLIIFSLIYTFGSTLYSQNKVEECKIQQNLGLESISIDTAKYKLSPRSLILKDDNNQYIEILKDNKIRYKEENKKNGLVKYKMYYLSGKILSYEIFYNKGNLGIGKKYLFDESGSISKVIDNDDPQNYTLCYKEAEAIVLKKMGKKYEIFVLKRENKIINNEKVYYWEVITSKIGSFKNADKREFWIHGKTGKIIKILKLRVSTDDYFKE